MAASSSSSSHDKSFHVFPSFHGPEVRKTFLSHLRKYFTIIGIMTFKDQEIERGRTIGPELLKAIREARVSIVVLSTNYASSNWCLNELVEILKCREDQGQIVMPVFYEVDPSHVRKQKGDFGVAFEKTCEGETEEQKQRWIDALTCVAEIAGEHSRNWSDEAAMLEKLTTDVSNKLKVELLKEQFRSLDVDQTGFISVPELRYAMESIGEKITDDEVKEMIREVDLDGDGRLNYDEFAKVMMANPKRKKKRKRFCSARMTDEERARAKKFATEEEMRKLFMFGDIDNDVGIAFGIAFGKSCQGRTEEEKQRWSNALAYVATIARKHSINWMSDEERARAKKFATDVTLPKEVEEEMRKIFMFGDLDNDGFITEAEIRFVMTRDGSKVTDDEVKDAIRAGDDDGDGRLNYDEFVKLMIKMAAMVKNFTTDVTMSKEDEEEIRGLFMAGDVDNDGFITEAELRYVLTRSGANITEDDVKNAIKAADVDGDGRLSYDDFVKYKMAMKMIEEAPKGKNLVMQRIVNIFRAFVKHDLGFCVFDKLEFLFNYCFPFL